MQRRNLVRYGLPAVIVIIIAVIVAVVLLLREPTVEPGTPPQSDTPEEAAQQGLQTLRDLVNEDNYQMLGFESVAEAEGAELGNPLPVFRVQLDQLRAYEGEEARELLVAVGRTMYPVLVDDAVRSSVAVEGEEDQWTGTDFGAPNLMRALAEMVETDNDYIVHVAFLNLYFIARDDEEAGVLLVPIIDDARFDFSRGEPMPAAEVFERLQPVAEDFDEDLPT